MKVLLQHFVLQGLAKWRNFRQAYLYKSNFELFPKSRRLRLRRVRLYVAGVLIIAFHKAMYDIGKAVFESVVEGYEYLTEDLPSRRPISG